MLKDKKILVGISGSIAAYKTAYLVRMLIREGAQVKVIMTESAAKFITPLTLSTLSGNRVLLHLSEEDGWENHALLGRWADLMVIAPASCNTISKMALGTCDNLLTAVYLSATCPVMIAPAMDEDMWLHPSTRRNVAQLINDHIRVLEVEEGELASGLTGKGRMKEPEDIFEEVKFFFERDKQLKGKKVLITAGPTIEPIDPVRFISNHSSGKMGLALTQAFLNAGAEVQLICGPIGLPVPAGVKVNRVTTAEEMFEATMKEFSAFDMIVMAAAVADYTPQKVAVEKIKKAEDLFDLKLVKTKDILAEAGKRKGDQQLLVGFALETDHEVENALAKLEKKNADFIVLNSLKDHGASFQSDTNKVNILGKDGSGFEIPLQSKSDVAKKIVSYLSKFIK